LAAFGSGVFTFFASQQHDSASGEDESTAAQQQPEGEEAFPWQKSFTRPSGQRHWELGSPAVTVMTAASVARNFVSDAPSKYIHIPPLKSIDRDLGKVK
jgi:hypothetical protein